MEADKNRLNVSSKKNENFYWKKIIDIFVRRLKVASWTKLQKVHKFCFSIIALYQPNDICRWWDLTASTPRRRSWATWSGAWTPTGTGPSTSTSLSPWCRGGWPSPMTTWFTLSRCLTGTGTASSPRRSSGQEPSYHSLLTRAWKEGYAKVPEDFTITEKAPSIIIVDSFLNVKALVGINKQERAL